MAAKAFQTKIVSDPLYLEAWIAYEAEQPELDEHDCIAVLTLLNWTSTWQPFTKLSEFFNKVRRSHHTCMLTLAAILGSTRKRTSSTEVHQTAYLLLKSFLAEDDDAIRLNASISLREWEGSGNES